jgi:CMP/dCMP kinase
LSIDGHPAKDLSERFIGPLGRGLGRGSIWVSSMRKLIIAIDGPVGSGKSSVARRVAELLGYTFLDSGAMYRALALKALRQGVPLDAPRELEALAGETHIDLEPMGSAGAGVLRVRLDGADVTEAIRSAEVSQAASKVAVIPGVRRVLVAEQRRAGERGGVVMEGRDIGTVVFPDADLKIFLDASPEVRAERRWRESEREGERIEFARMMEEVRQRDRRDREREASPLARASDAVVVDNTAMDVEETARLIVLLARERESASTPAKADS